MIHQRLDTFTARQILDLVQPDLGAARSISDLRKRLSCKGYGIKRTRSGVMLTAEPHSIPLFPIRTSRFSTAQS